MKNRHNLMTMTTAILGALAGTVSYAGTALAACPNAPAVPSALVVVLLDRSGSMASQGQCTSSVVDRKWKCAVDDAHSWITNNDPLSERAYFLWQFSTLDPTLITTQDNGPGGNGYCMDTAYTNLTTANPVFVGPMVDDSATPLAGAYCDAVKFLIDYRNAKGWTDVPLFIKLESDGLENRTPVTHVCYGPTGGSSAFTVPHNPVQLLPVGAPTTVDTLQLGSWESKIYDTQISGSVHSYTPTVDPAAFVYASGPMSDGPVITNISFIDEFIPPAAAAASLAFSVSSATAGVDGSSASSSASRVATSALAASALATTSTTDDLVRFFSGFTQISRTRLTRFGSGVAPVAGSVEGFHVLPGDADDSGCVNVADFNLVKAAYGQRTSATNANANRADLNGDGVVNGADYLMLKARYGQGCATPPGTIPVLGNALFGFEDPSKWSSSAPIAGNSLRRTEGGFSLKVDGGGYREIKSVAFNTALFTGVKAKIALDVFVPPLVKQPYWAGQVLLFVNAPSAGINNLPVGTVELAGKPINKFSQITFSLPTTVQNAMKTARSDFSIKVVVNATDSGQQIDNLRFVQ